MSAATTAATGTMSRRPDMPAWAYVGSIEVSQHDADTIYVASTCFKHDDYRPYLYRSTDGGKSWASLSDSFP